MHGESYGFVGVVQQVEVTEADGASIFERFANVIAMIGGEALKQVEQYMLKREDVGRIYLAVGGFGGGEVNTAMVFVSLKPQDQSNLKQSEIMNEVRQDLSKLPNLKVFLQDLSTRGFTAQRGFPAEFNILGAEWAYLD